MLNKYCRAQIKRAAGTGAGRGGEDAAAVETKTGIMRGEEKNKEDTTAVRKARRGEARVWRRDWA